LQSAPNHGFELIHTFLFLFLKDYKKQMDVSIKKHRKEMTKKIKNLRSNNSKEFWKLMRKGTYRKQPNISIDTLFKIEKFSEKNI
jgi:hypothetical protein